LRLTAAALAYTFLAGFDICQILGSRIWHPPNPWHLPNPANLARNLAGAGLGWISEKWLDSGSASAEIWYITLVNGYCKYTTKVN